MPSFPYYTGGFGSNAIDGLYAPGNSGITTNYKADDGTDLGAVCKASMHSSDRRGPVPYYVNGTATSDLFRDVGFQPVSIDIIQASVNNGSSGNTTSASLTASVSGTNVNSNNYSVKWKFEYLAAGPFGSATPNSDTSLTTDFNGSLEPLDYTTVVSCTITDSYTGETAIDYAIIDWYMQ